MLVKSAFCVKLRERKIQITIQATWTENSNYDPNYVNAKFRLRSKLCEHKIQITIGFLTLGAWTIFGWFETTWIMICLAWALTEIHGRNFEFSGILREPVN